MHITCEELQSFLSTTMEDKNDLLDQLEEDIRLNDSKLGTRE